MTGRCRAVLVGAEQQQNLALGYLASAAERAGHEITCVGFTAPGDAPRVLGAVARARPAVVGLSIAFQHALADHRALASALRDAGYRGHLTCGGQVPTFCGRELLADTPALDTAVRHEGERTFVELLDRIGRGDRPEGIPGLLWRQGSEILVGPPRAPVRDLDELADPHRPKRPHRTNALAVAPILTSRGCFGVCSYCSVQAFAGLGGPRLRLRSPERVADEVAALSARGVRALLIEDDLFLLPHEQRALARLAALRAAFTARGLGPLAIWAKARPESVTPTVIAAARELGVVHLFLGVESASPARLAYLGRTHAPADSDRALALCRQHDVEPSFNLLLFDPDATLEQIAESLALARREIGTPWTFGRTEPYPGTPLLERLRAEGRLVGDYRGYGYVMRDERAELLFRLLRIALGGRALSRDSLLGRLVSLGTTLRLRRHLDPTPPVLALAEAARALLARAQADTVDALERSLHFATRVAPGDGEATRAFAIYLGLATGRTDAAIAAAAREIAARVERLDGAGGAR